MNLKSLIKLKSKEWKLIKAGKNFVKVDSDDFDLLSKFNWNSFYSYDTKTYYVNRSVVSITPDNKKKWSTVQMPRFILNTPKGLVVDHINHDTLDNRKCNLRVCSRSENAMNRNKAVKNSNFKGVTIKVVYYGKNKQNKHIYIFSEIGFNNKKIYLGTFKTPVEAAKAYDEAAIKYFGEFALTNEMLGLFSTKQI